MLLHLLLHFLCDPDDITPHHLKKKVEPHHSFKGTNDSAHLQQIMYTLFYYQLKHFIYF